MKVAVALVSALLLVVLLAPVAVSLVASVPGVQNAIARQVTARLSERLGVEVSMERMRLHGVNRVVVNGFRVGDLNADTLLWVRRLEAPVLDWGLGGGILTFGRVELHGAEMWIRRDASGVVNIREVVKAIRGGRPRNPDPKFRMHIVGIQADSITFGLLRDDRPPRARGVDFGRFVTENTRVVLDDFTIDGSQVRMRIRELAFDEGPLGRGVATGLDMRHLEAEQLLVARGLVALSGVRVRARGSDVALPHVRLVGARPDWKIFRSLADSVALDIAVGGGLRNGGGELRRTGGGEASGGNSAQNRLTTDLLGLFVPAVAGLGMTFEDVDVRVHGPLAALAGEVESLRLGEGTSLAMSFASRGLPDVRGSSVEGTISRLEVAGTDLPGGAVGRAWLEGQFAGSVAEMALEGALGFEGVEAGALLKINGLGAASGNFEGAATLAAAEGGRPKLTGSAAGEVTEVEFGGHVYRNIMLAGEAGAQGYEAEVRVSDPWAYLGLRGELSARVEGEGSELKGEAELADVVYVTEHDTVTTPRMTLAVERERGEMRARLESEFGDVDARRDAAGEVRAELTTKQSDGLLRALGAEVSVAEGSRVEIEGTGRENFRLEATAERIEAGRTLITEIKLAGERRGERTRARLTGGETYLGRLHLADGFDLHGRAEEGEMAVSLDGERWLTATGTMGKRPTDTLTVRLDNFDLAPLGRLMRRDADLRGRASGEVRVASALQDPRVDADVVLERLDAALLDPLLAGVLQNTSGEANAHLRAHGAETGMRIEGEVEIPTLETTLRSTGVTYSLEGGRITIDDSRARLEPVTLSDSHGGEARVEAEVDLTSLRAVSARVGVGLENLRVLDTARGGFHGTAAATGTVELATDRMGTRVEVDARTERGTRLHLPLSADGGEIDWADFVVFRQAEVQAVGGASPVRRVARQRRRPMEANLRLDITPDAEVNLLIDPRMGRGITARGEGTIALRVNPAENLMTMTGDYTIAEGRVELSMMDVITRNFTIAPGSSLRWNGAPGDATMAVKAAYRVRTSLTPLVGEQNPLFSGRATVPVDCVLSLTGELAAPEITFDIELPSADPDQRLIAESAMNTDEAKSMQFLSLLTTGSFAPGSSLTGVGTAGQGALASGAVGFDILTGQLSNLLSSEEYDVWFRYRPQEGFAQNRVDVGFSTGFVDDRLLLEIEGNYIDDRSATSVGTGNVTNLAGDVSLTWVIDDAGNLRLKVFTQTIDRLNETQGLQESGLGVYYKKDFNRLSDIIRRKNTKFARDSVITKTK